MAVNNLQHFPNTQTHKLFPCMGCQQFVAKVKKCAACLKTTYCSSECQKSHWKKNHRVRCFLHISDKIKPLIKEIQDKWPPNKAVKKISSNSSEEQFKGINLDTLGNNLSMHVTTTESILNYLKDFTTAELNELPEGQQVDVKPIISHLTNNCTQALCNRYDFNTADPALRLQYESLINNITDVAMPCGKLKTKPERKAFLKLVITAYKAFFNLKNECFQCQLDSLDITAETKGKINEQLARFDELVEKVCTGVNRSL